MKQLFGAALTAVVLTALAPAAGSRTASAQDRRREPEGATRRGEEGQDARHGRRGVDVPPQAETLQNDKLREVVVTTPMQCGSHDLGQLRAALLSLESPPSDFYLELWSDKQRYHLLDPVYYYVRSNRKAYVTLFWIGPDKGVFMPFMNIEIEPDRDHRLDPSNIIVEPVGREVWRAVATEEPQRFPCLGAEGDYLSELARVRTLPFAAARWEVTSTVE